MKKGFSLAEALVTFMLVGTISAATLPLMTQISEKKSNLDKNVMKCVANNSLSGWYDDITGDTTLTSASSVCYASILDVQYDRGSSLTTAKWFADHGTGEQQVQANAILRSACDLGGEKACDYFIEHCWKSGSASAPYCDNTSNFLDLTYYLHMHRDTNTNVGAQYIADRLEGILPKMIPNLINEVVYACTANQSPNNNQNLTENIACELSAPDLYIRACNAGNVDACTVAYNAEWNRSCTQVKLSWDNASTGNYMLTYNGSDSPVSVYCNMSSIVTAAITGCEAEPYVPLDCEYGRSNNYNQTCSEIFANWETAPNGNYNLTENTADPPNPGESLCERAPVCHADDIGTDCLGNNTLFLGDWMGYQIFTTVGDHSLNSRYGFFATQANALDQINGIANMTKLIPGSSAAEICNSIVEEGFSDWYLPSIGELNKMYQADSSGAFGFTGRYWSSTENEGLFGAASYFYAWTQNLENGEQDAQFKNQNYKVRCVRRVSP